MVLTLEDLVGQQFPEHFPDFRSRLFLRLMPTADGSLVSLRQAGVGVAEEEYHRFLKRKKTPQNSEKLFWVS